MTLGTGDETGIYMKNHILTRNHLQFQNLSRAGFQWSIRISMGKLNLIHHPLILNYLECVL